MHCTSCSCIWALVRYHICTCNLYATTGYTWHSLKRGSIMITFSPSACLSCCPSHADIKPTRPAIARYDGCSPELCPCGQSIYLPAWTRLQVGESITMQKWNSLQGGQVHHTDTAVRWWTLWVVFSSSCISALKYVVIIWFAINILWTLNIIMMMKPWASLVKECSWIDPDFREQSLTEWLVPARALIFGITKNFDPGSLRDSYVCKQIVDFVRCFVCFKVFFLSFFLIRCCWHLFVDSMYINKICVTVIRNVTQNCCQYRYMFV